MKQLKLREQIGVCYSCLLQLPYFNAPRMCIIDPMHNLFGGMAKMMVELWKPTGVLSNKDFDTVQEQVDSFFALLMLVTFLPRFVPLSQALLQSSGNIEQFYFLPLL